MTPIEILVQADKDEEDGNWELAAWRRLVAVYGPLPEGNWMGRRGEMFTVELDLERAIIIVATADPPYIYIQQDFTKEKCPDQRTWSAEQGWQRWYKGKLLTDATYPLWARSALEQASKVSVAAILKPEKET